MSHLKKRLQDYYPFGMQMPGRNGTISGGEYRYAFNGMETDKEVSGTGNSYTTQFRQYDPRLGRWKSIDPLMHKFPGMSPYVAFNNNPIYYTDPLGLEGTPGDVVTGKDKQGFETVTTVITVKGVEVKVKLTFFHSGELKGILITNNPEMKNGKLKEDLYSQNLYTTNKNPDALRPSSKIFFAQSTKINKQSKENKNVDTILKSLIPKTQFKGNKPVPNQNNEILTGTDGTPVTVNDVMKELSNQGIIEVVVVGNEQVLSEHAQGNGDGKFYTGDESSDAKFTEDTDGDGTGGTKEDFTLKRAIVLADYLFKNWKNVITVGAWDKNNPYKNAYPSTKGGGTNNGGTVIFRKKNKEVPKQHVPRY